MIAELLERADRGEDVGLFSLADVADLFGGEEVLVDLFLQGSKAAADDLDEFGGEMLGVQRVGAAEDELIYQGRHVVLRALCF